MVSPIDDVLGFFDHFAAIEAEVYDGLLVDELDMMAEIKLRRKLKPLFDGKPGSFVEFPTRPIVPTTEWLEERRSKKRGPRTVFAAQVVATGDDKLVFAYCDEYVKNALGMWNRFALGFVGDFLVIVARHVRCGDCDGLGCGLCKRQGWRYVAGRELGKVTVKETRTLIAPTDVTSLGLYESML